MNVTLPSALVVRVLPETVSINPELVKITSPFGVLMTTFPSASAASRSGPDNTPAAMGTVSVKVVTPMPKLEDTFTVGSNWWMVIFWEKAWVERNTNKRLSFQIAYFLIDCMSED